jgi:type IV secretion system protein VirB9
MKALLFLAAGCVLASPALALTEPVPDTPSEPRVRHVEYVPNEIVKVVVPLSSETQIVLSPEETGKIDFSVAQQAWRHARAGNTLVVAPNPAATTTFAHVVSTLASGKTRTYTFELSVAPGSVSAGGAQIASADGAVPAPAPPPGYAAVRFTYERADREARTEAAAEAKRAAAQDMRTRRVALAQGGPPVVRARSPAVQQRRCDFLWRGATAILPQAACNGGTTTSFLWAGQIAVPAIFVVTADGREQAVTQAPDPSRAGLIVVPQTAQRWVLRSGPNQVAELFDAAYDPLAGDVVPGANTPQQHWLQQKREARR